MDIVKIDKLTLQSECNRLVKKYNMARRKWQNVKTIVSDIFEYASILSYLDKMYSDTNDLGFWQYSFSFLLGFGWENW